MQQIPVYFIPGSLKNNPYLALLSKGITAVSGEEKVFVPQPFSHFALLRRTLNFKPSIVHVHWETNIYGSKYWWYALIKMTTRFLGFHLLRLMGVRFVWTMHNMHAHDYPYPFIDELGRRNMWSLAHKVIVQNESVIPELSAAHPHARIVYIPHGNYIDVYGPRISKVEVREKLSLFKNAEAVKQDTKVLLALGAIRPYKKLETLIEAMKGSKALLLIAGKGEQHYVEKLRLLVGDNSRVKIISEFIADEQIPFYLGAADYAVFAHGDSSLTSGAILLALSYGVPVITQPMPAAEIIQEGINGYVATGNVFNALLARISELPVLDPEQVLATVAAQNWEYVGKETRAVYASSI